MLPRREVRAKGLGTIAHLRSVNGGHVDDSIALMDLVANAHAALAQPLNFWKWATAPEGSFAISPTVVAGFGYW